VAGLLGRDRITVAAARAVAALGHQVQEGVKAARVEMGAAVALQVGQGTVGRARARSGGQAGR
jgi:hypothetical protein